MRHFLYPIALWVAVLVTLAAESCKLDTHTFGAPGHRIDQPPVILVTPTKPDADGGDQ